MFRQFILIALLFSLCSSAWAQSATEITLRYQLGQALASEAQAEAKNLQGADDLRQAQEQRDWWIFCAKDAACLAWAVGEHK